MRTFTRTAAVCTALVGVGSHALADGKAPDPENVARADALFNAGRSLLEAGEFGDACPKFKEAKQLAPGLGVILYLADCYERLGRTSSARLEFREAEQLATVRADKRRAVAHDRATSLEARVPSLAVVVPPRSVVAGLTIARDGEPLPKTAWGTAIPLDPGEHSIIASAPSRKTLRIGALLPAARDTVTVTVPPLEDESSAPLLEPPPAPIGPTPTTPPQPHFSPSPAASTGRVVGLAIGGMGVTAIGVGAAFGLVALSKLQQANGGPCDPSDRCSPAGLELRQDAERAGNASTAWLVVGGAALVSGVLLYMASGPAATSNTGVGVSPMMGRQSDRLGWGGSW